MLYGSPHQHWLAWGQTIPPTLEKTRFQMYRARSKASERASVFNQTPEVDDKVSPLHRSARVELQQTGFDLEIFRFTEVARQPGNPLYHPRAAFDVLENVLLRESRVVD